MATGTVSEALSGPTEASKVKSLGRLTIDGIAKRRAQSGPIVAGAAAPADVWLYKGGSVHLHKCKAKNWSHRMTSEAKTRKGNRLQASAKWLKTPGLISLGGGLPSSAYFPFETLKFETPHIYTQSTLPETMTNGITSCAVGVGKFDMRHGLSGFDIATALQYGQGHGAAQLLRFFVEHTELIHNPPYRDWSCTMTVGNTSALDIVLRMFTKPGDWILSEDYTFPAAIETAAPLCVRVAPIAMDEDGMKADCLDQALSSWTLERGPKPFLLYTVPTGHNPTGRTISAQRRRELYTVAQKHDLIVVEDEPYYFLQLDPYAPLGGSTTGFVAADDHEGFIESLCPSFLSLDVDGRVIRMDSLSKVIAPGSRVGWITASEQIVNAYWTHASLSTQGPSGFSQLVLYKLLEDHWGHAGYLNWLIYLRKEYTARRNVMLAACEHHLPGDVVSWEVPSAGIFMWVKLDIRKHPQYSQKTVLEIEDDLFMKAVLEHKTMMVKGSWFNAREDQARTAELSFRATFAAESCSDIREGVRRFGNAVRQEFELDMVDM